MEIICPCCGQRLVKENNTFRCLNNHSFDIAKEGYINLIGKSHSGDNNSSIQGRRLFLERGYFLPLKEELKKIIKEYDIQELLDVGCGEGYYDRDCGVAELMGIDVSKEAIKKAAKNSPYFYCVASANNLPVNQTKSILSVFAPVFLEELRRVMSDRALLIKVTPKAHHLMELKEVLYHTVRESVEKEIHEEDFLKIYSKDLTYSIHVPQEHLKALLAMTPYAFTTSPQDIQKLDALEYLDITCDFNISIYEYHI